MEQYQRANQLDPLSKERLQSQVAELLVMGSKLKALSSPLAKPKTNSLRNSIILPNNNNINSSGNNNTNNINNSGNNSGNNNNLTKQNNTNDVVDLSNLTTLRLLCARLSFIGHLKYHLWRIIYNIEKNKIESSAELEEMLDHEDDDDDENDDNNDKNNVNSSASSSSKKKNRKDFSKQLNALPYVPMSTEILSWNIEPPKNKEELLASSTTPSTSTTATSSSNSNNNLMYSIHGLGLFLVKYQRLYSLFMEVRLQYQENQDQNAIMRSASFLESLNNFAKEYKISLDSNLLMPSLSKSLSTSKPIKEPTNERLDISVTSFLNLPDWICPR